MERNKGIRDGIVFECIIIVILVLSCISVLYPLILILSGSFSDPFAVMRNEVKLFPVRPTLRAYQLVFKNSEIWNSYWNTIIYTSVGTLINLSMTAFGAYPLSRRDFYGRKIIAAIFIFTMFFTAGMIPVYILVKSLGLYNTMWAILLPGAISTYNLIIMTTYFQNSIPVEMVEAAAIDGENDIGILFKIVLPLSMPILAVMVLFYGVSHWNSWFSALLYLSSRIKYPLQMILREIILQGSTSDMSGGAVSDQEMIGEGIKYATMVVATVPILCLYPFLQKYFVKGVMIGAIKG